MSLRGRRKLANILVSKYMLFKDTYILFIGLTKCIRSGLVHSGFGGKERVDLDLNTLSTKHLMNYLLIPTRRDYPP